MERTTRSLTNNTAVPEHTSHVSYYRPQDPISDEVVFYSAIYLIGVATSSLSFFGVVSNIINFVVLFRESGSDCVSVCLIALTCSDFGAMLVNLIYSLSFFAKIEKPGLTFDPDAIQYVMSWACNFFFDISMSVTAFVSVERCLCVVMPFHFKNVFTFRVALISIIAIYAFNIGSYLPIFLTLGFQRQFDHFYNKIRIRLWLSPDRAGVEKFSNIFTHIAAATICQIIVVVSTQVMVIGLQRSSKFRQAKASAPPLPSIKENGRAAPYSGCDATNDIALSKGSGTKSGNLNQLSWNKATSKRNGVTTKSKSVSKMVSIVAGIFIACNFWRLALVYARRIQPAIFPTGYLRNTYTFLIGIWQFIGAVNCSVNIFVYYTHRTTYKETFIRTFCLNSGQDAVCQRDLNNAAKHSGRLRQGGFRKGRPT